MLQALRVLTERQLSVVCTTFKEQHNILLPQAFTTDLEGRVDEVY